MLLRSTLKSLLILLTLAPGAVTAQTLTLEWADEAKTKGWESVVPVGQVGDRLYFVKWKDLSSGRIGYTLASYSKGLTDPKEYPVYNSIGSGSSTIIEEPASLLLSERNQAAYFISNRVNRTTKAVTTVLNAYDLDGKQTVKDETLYTYSFEGGKARAATSEITVARDSSLVAVYQFVPAKRKESEQLVAQVFASGFQSKVWEREVTLPYASKDATFEQAALDKNGTLYLLYEIRNEAAKTDPLLAKYIYSIFRVEAEGEPTEYVVDFKEQEVESVAIGLDQEGRLRVSGFYGAKGARRNSSGFFAFNLDGTSGEPSNRFQQEIPELYASDITNKRKYEYRWRKVFLREDGGQVILAEQYLYYVVTTNTGYATTTTFHYVYGPAALISLSPTQEVEWVRRVPKLQHTINDGGFYSSAYGFWSDESIVLVYNDDPDNLTVLEDSKYNDLDQSRRMKKAAVMAAIVDREGKLSKQLLQAYSPELGVTIVPRYSRRISETEHLVVARWRKDYRLGILRVK